jgi:single-strand DNA-binding protein
MFSLNRAQVIGNVTRDPEMRQTPGGQSVANFGVATNRVWTDAKGQKQEEAEFHNVVAWGKLAEICSQYAGKGRKVFVEGRLRTREWEGQDGQKRRSTEIVAENVIILDRPSGSGAPRSASPVASNMGFSSDAPSFGNSAPAEEVRVDDIPF